MQKTSIRLWALTLLVLLEGIRTVSLKEEYITIVFLFSLTGQIMFQALHQQRKPFSFEI